MTSRPTPVPIGCHSCSMVTKYLILPFSLFQLQFNYSCTFHCIAEGMSVTSKFSFLSQGVLPNFQKASVIQKHWTREFEEEFEGSCAVGLEKCCLQYSTFSLISRALGFQLVENPVTEALAVCLPCLVKVISAKQLQFSHLQNKY